VYILNRAPTKAVDGMTPYEAWHGRRPDVHHFRTFGCVVFIKETKPNLKKLDDRGTPIVFIGYEPGAKAWRFYNPASRRAVVSRHAVFNEPVAWTWESKDMGAAPDFAIEHHTLELGDDQYTIDSALGTSTPSPGTSTPTGGSPAPTPTSPSLSTPAPLEPPSPAPKFVSPPPDAEEYLDADADNVEPRYRTIDNVIEAVTPPGSPRQVATELHLQMEEEPVSFAEVEKHPCWRQAMMEEMDSIESNKT
jgi:hypothetical protein